VLRFGVGIVETWTLIEVNKERGRTCKRQAYKCFKGWIVHDCWVVHGRQCYIRFVYICNKVVGKRLH